MLRWHDDKEAFTVHDHKGKLNHKPTKGARAGEDRTWYLKSIEEFLENVNHDRVKHHRYLHTS